MRLTLILLLFSATLNAQFIMTNAGGPSTQLPPYDATPNYYVDNTGTGDTLATITEVNALDLDGGDSIFFKKGCTWREQLTVPNSGTAINPIVFDAYGSGNSPKITGADTLMSFTDQTSNVWARVVSLEPKILIINGEMGIKAVDSLSVDGANKWFYTPYDDSLFVYYESDPSGLIEVAVRNRVLDISNKNYITVNNLTIEGGNAPGGIFDYRSIYVGTANMVGIKFNYDTIKNCEGAGLMFAASTSMTDCDVNGCYFLGTYGDGIWGNTTNIKIDLDIDSTTFESCGLSSPSVEANGLFGYLGGATVQNCTFAYCGRRDVYSHGIYVFPSTDTVIIRNSTFYGNRAAGITLRGSARVENCYSYSNGMAGININRTGTTNRDIDLIGNVIYDNGDYAIIAGQNGTSNTVNLKLYYNSIDHRGTDDAVIIQDTTELFVMVGNAIRTDDEYCFIDYYGGTTQNIDSNCYYREDAGATLKWDNVDYNWATWQGLSYDAAGLNVDPTFTTTTNLHPQTGSPLLGAGADLAGRIVDIEGVTLSSPPNIGAYEDIEDP